MEDLKEEMQNVLSGSPAVVEQTAQTTNIPQQDTLPATNIKTFSPTSVEQISPDDDSGLIDFTTGYKSDGQANLAGVAGARRPISGERGDPFFLDPVERYKEVAPFDLYLPSLGKYAKLNTTQPDKAGWQLLRAEGKLPEYDYMGYYRMREAPTENGVMAFIKGVPANVSKLGLAMGRAVTSYPYEMGLQDSYTARQPAVKPAPGDAGAMWDYLSKTAATDGMISPQAKKINDWWNETYGRIDDVYGVGTYENPSLGAEIGSGVASGLASIGMLYLAPLPGTASMSLMNFGMSSPRIYYDAMNAGVSPSGAKIRALAGGAAITALDSLAFIGSSVMRNTRRAAVGEVLRDNGFGKTLWRVARKAPVEMGTEMAQGAIEDWLAMALQTPEDWEASLDARALEALTAGMAFVASSIPEYHNLTKQQRAEKIAEFVKNGGGVVVYNQMAKMLAPAIKDGILKKSDVAKLTGLALDYNNIDFVSDRMQAALLGAMDKATPEQVNALLEKVRKLKDSGAELSAEAFDKLDALVAQRVKDGGFADADVPLYQALFRGLAAIKAYNKGEMLSDADIGRFFSMEKIGPSDKTLGAYNKETDTTVIKRAPKGGKSAFDVYIRKGFQPDSSLTERVKTILHEFSHKIDAIVGEPGAAQFMADYIEAVSEVFSAEHAKAVAEGAKGKPKGGTKYTKYSDASEWKAQAIERLGRAAQKYLGLNGSKAREFISFANMMINGVKTAGMADKAISDYHSAMAEQIKKNGDRWSEVMDYYGQKELANKIRAFLGDSSTTAESVGISGDDMAKIVRVLKGYLDDLGIAKVESVMSLDDVEPFIEKADRLFAEGVESANKESERLLGKGEKTQGSTEKPSNSAEAFFDREEFMTDDELQSRRVEGYHSSPDSQFDNPSTSAIGSGEGGAAHGWGTENIVQYSSKDPLEQYGLMPATAQKNEAVKVKKQTFGEWYAENDVDTVIKNTEAAIKNQSGLRTRFPKFAKFWGKMTAGNVMSTLDWLGGKELVEQFDLVNAERVWNNERFAIQEATQAKAMKEMGKNAIQMEAFYNDMARGRVKITEADGKVRVLNGFEMMDVLLNDEQPFAKERGALAFQDGQAGVDAVIAAMTPEMKQYAHLMRDKIAELREEYQKILGMRFRDWENYWPVTDARGQLLSKNRVFSDYSRDTGAKGKLQIRDAREKFNMYVNRVALAKSGYYKQLTLLRSMIAGVPERFSEISGDEVALAARLEEGNIKINTMIQEALGEDGAMKFLEAIDTLMRSPTQDIVSFNKGVLGKAVANARISRLVWAPISWAKNATNIFLQANADPDGSASYWKGLANALSNPKEAWDFMMQFPSIRNRLKGITVDEFLQATNVSPSMLTDLANMINSGNSTPSKVMAQLAAIAKMANRTGQSFMLLGDAFGNVFGLYGYASKLMTKYNGDVDMVDRALHDHIVHTQSSTLRSVKSSFHRKLLALPVVGGLASFTGDPVQKFNTMGHTIAQAIVGEKTFGEASRAVLPIVMATMAFIMASVGIGDLWDDDEENDVEVYNALNNELVSQALGFTPLANVMAPAVKKLFGMQDAGMNTPFTSMMNDTATAINKGKWEDVALDTATLFGGIYVDRFANTVDGFGDVLLGDTPEDREIGARRAIGRTKRFAEKRVRPSKKKVENKQ